MGASEFEGDVEVRLSFTRKNGKKRTIPVWFTVHGKELELLPMYGLRTKWLAEVEAGGRIEVRGRKEAGAGVPRIVREEQEVDRIKERFAKKYGESDVRRYYPTSEVALVLEV